MLGAGCRNVGLSVLRKGAIRTVSIASNNRIGGYDFDRGLPTPIRIGYDVTRDRYLAGLGGFADHLADWLGGARALQARASVGRRQGSPRPAAASRRGGSSSLHPPSLTAPVTPPKGP